MVNLSIYILIEKFNNIGVLLYLTVSHKILFLYFIIFFFVLLNRD